MNVIRLVQINQASEPAESALVMSDAAQQACAVTSALYEVAGFDPPWVGYLAIWNEQIVGTCGFNTIAFPAPGANGKAEIAYWTFPEFEGRGFATRMAQALIEVARTASPTITLLAHTLPQTNASNRILKKLGFRFSGVVQDPEDGEVWRWELTRVEH